MFTETNRFWWIARLSSLMSLDVDDFTVYNLLPLGIRSNPFCIARSGYVPPRPIYPSVSFAFAYIWSAFICTIFPVRIQFKDSNIWAVV